MKKFFQNPITKTVGVIVFLFTFGYLIDMVFVLVDTFAPHENSQIIVAISLIVLLIGSSVLIIVKLIKDLCNLKTDEDNLSKKRTGILLILFTTSAFAGIVVAILLLVNPQ